MTLRKLGKEPRTLRVEYLTHAIPGIHNLPVEMLPVIQSCPLQGAIIESKSGRTNDPEFRLQRNARSADVAGILWDFGLKQDNV
jgi:hypothetical protein